MNVDFDVESFGEYFPRPEVFYPTLDAITDLSNFKVKYSKTGIDI